MMFLVVILLTLLALLPLYAWQGWRIIRNPDPALVKPRISVIIPFRNEENRILPLLKSLKGIRYEPDSHEIIFVDDHSTDNGSAVVKEWVGDRTNARLITLPEARYGKKAALTAGIGQASGEIILTTDADSRVPAGWLEYTSAMFRDKRTVMAPGLVAPAGTRGLLAGLAALDMAALTGFSAGSLALGQPSMCNGANLAFRKEAFDEVDGYLDNMHIPSGDDEFLLHKMAAAYPGGVAFNIAPEALVHTQVADKLREFVDQRSRWASKWKYNRQGAWLAPLLVVCYLALIAGWIYAVFNPAWLLWMTGFTGLKWLSDFLLVRRVMRAWGRSPNGVIFLAGEMLYPWYVLFFALSVFRKQYVWKDRRYEGALT